MNAIILTIDRLRASALGAYGNTWFETPELDRLASESFACDQALIDSPHLASLLRSCLSGMHAVRSDSAEAENLNIATLADQLRGRATRSTWISDETDSSLDDLADSFDEKIVLAENRREENTEQPVAETIEATHQARLWATVSNWLAQQDAPPDPNDEGDNSGPFLLWVHAQGMAGPWDAPLELRNSLVEEDDPEPLQDAIAPNRILPDDFDPDEVHSAACAYAGQIMALDACLGALFDQLRNSDLLQDTMIVLLGLRGFPLGEHRRLGPNDEPLYEELVHVPCLFRMPDGVGSLSRSQNLFQPSDLFATLADWFTMKPLADKSQGQSWLPRIRGEASPSDSQRKLALIQGNDSQRALRTNVWYLLQGSSSPESDLDSEKTVHTNSADHTLELFVKPDDRMEQNEIAARCGDVADSLTSTLNELEHRLRAGEPTDTIEII